MFELKATLAPRPNEIMTRLLCWSWYVVKYLIVPESRTCVSMSWFLGLVTVPEILKGSNVFLLFSLINSEKNGRNIGS